MIYEYNAALIRVIDGDTIEVTVDLGFSVYHRRILRLRGINTPELNSTISSVRDDARAAKDFLIAHLPPRFVIRTVKDKGDKYGRMLVEILVGEQNINWLMIEQGHAVPYMLGAHAGFHQPPEKTA